MADVLLTETFSMDEATLRIDVDNFEAAITGAILTPQQAGSTRLITGRYVRGRARWQLALGHVQSTAPTGLTRYLLDNEGETKAITLTPLDGGDAIEVDVIIAPGQIGANASPDGMPATATATMDCDTRPAFVTPAP